MMKTYFFGKFTIFSTLIVLDHCTHLIMTDCAYFVQSPPPRAFSVSFNTLQVCYRYTEYVKVDV